MYFNINMYYITINLNINSEYWQNEIKRAGMMKKLGDSS